MREKTTLGASTSRARQGAPRNLLTKPSLGPALAGTAIPMQHRTRPYPTGLFACLPLSLDCELFQGKPASSVSLKSVPTQCLAYGGCAKVCQITKKTEYITYHSCNHGG